MRHDSLGVLVERFIGSKTNPNTRIWYAKYLRPMAAFLGADSAIISITRVDAEGYWKSVCARKDAWASHPSRPKQPQGLSQTSLHNSLRAIRTFWKEMQRQRVVESNPFDHLRVSKDRRPVQMKAILPDDVRAIWEMARKVGAREYAIVTVLATTGLRAGELVSMSIHRLDLRKGTAWVNGKRGWRKVFLGEGSVQAITAYLQQRPTVASDALWLNGRNQPLGTDGIRFIVDDLAEQAGVRGKHNLHAFRHRAAQSWLDMGVNAEIVSQALGHADVNVTLLIYGNQDERRVQAAMRQVEMAPFIDSSIDGGDTPLTSLPDPLQFAVKQNQDGQLRQIVHVLPAGLPQPTPSNDAAR